MNQPVGFHVNGTFTGRPPPCGDPGPGRDVRPMIGVELSRVGKPGSLEVFSSHTTGRGVQRGGETPPAFGEAPGASCRSIGSPKVAVAGVGVGGRGRGVGRVRADRSHEYV